MKRTFYRLKSINLLIFFLAGALHAQVPFEKTAPNRYFIEFTDKDHNPYSLDNPGEFLSARSLARRQKQGIAIRMDDLPVTPAYIDSIRSTGAVVLNRSRWFNAVTVFIATDSIASLIARFPFVKKVPVSKQFASGKRKPGGGVQSIWDARYYDYGVSGWQSAIHHGNDLHQLGYTGDGITIAQLDAGFYHVDQLAAFSNLWANNRILGTRDFVNRANNLFESSTHGMIVLSIMGGYLPGELVGTAPDASYWLLRTEDTDSENLIEEDNWVAGAEFADSAGADVINTSLGYTQFADTSASHVYSDMDGKTNRVTIGADLAVSKGMVVVVSAGNLGASPWHYISSPADADSVLAVGAIDANGNIASFSGRGPSYDQRVKPDIVSIGKGTWMADLADGVRQGNGTSLSAPVMTGLVACLWQANPDATAMQVIQAIRESSDRYTHPDNDYGYGIPDFSLAHVLLTHAQSGSPLEGKMVIYPNPFHDELYLVFSQPVDEPVDISLYDMAGKMVLHTEFGAFQGRTYVNLDQDLSDLARGIYMLRAVSGTQSQVAKLLKF